MIQNQENMLRQNAEYDVVIVGAGMAGLAAAETLQSEGKLSFCVLEGRSRTGGRTNTQYPERGYLDMGGEFISQKQLNLQYYIDRFGLPVIPTYIPPDKNWIFQNKDGNIQSLASTSYPEMEQTEAVMVELNRLTLNAGANIEHPEATLNAKLLDSMTGQDWLDQLVKQGINPDTVSLAKIAMQGMLSIEPKDVSMLYMLYYAGTAGDYNTLAGVTGGPVGTESYRLQFGIDDLAENLVTAIGSKNIHFDCCVEEIQDKGTKGEPVIITVRQGDLPLTITAKKVIIAMSPTMSMKITMPNLPNIPGGQERINLCEGMIMGNTIKGFVSFKKPFWREKGLSGQTLSALPYQQAPLLWTLDNSFSMDSCNDVIITPAIQEKIAKVTYPYSLMTFIVGAAADYWQTKSLETRRQAVLIQLAQLLGEELWENIIQEQECYVEKPWAESAFSLGCPAGIMQPTILTKYSAALRRPIGNIHWAGTESATRWCGYIDGALQSGFRAAGEVS